MQYLYSTLFTFQLSRYKSLPGVGAPEPKAPVARMSEAQLVEDEIIQFRSVLEVSPRFCMLYDAPSLVFFARFS